MQRDLYIDFAKGMATLSVIFIHTVFWSGQFYTTPEIRVFSLLFDVVLFYALSGLTSGSNLEKTFYRLLKLQITYMLFVTLIFFIDYFFKVFGIGIFGYEKLHSFYEIFGGKYVPKEILTEPQWQNLGNWYLHQYSNCDTFPVVMGSFWYLKVYFILSFFGALILKFFPKHINLFIVLCVFLTLLFNIFPQFYPTGQVGYVAFYLGVFLIAHQLKGKKISSKQIPVFYLFVAFSLAALFFIGGKNVFYQINKLKFPPKLPYIIWTLFSIVTLFILYNRLKITKDNFINHIGRNAIFYYFAQGISSSLIYFIVVPFHAQFHRTLFMILMFILNLIIAIFLAEVLKKWDAFGWRLLEKIKKKTASKN